MKKVTLYLVDGSKVSTHIDQWDRKSGLESFKGVYTWGPEGDYVIVNGEHIVKIQVEEVG